MRNSGHLHPHHPQTPASASVRRQTSWLSIAWKVWAVAVLQKPHIHSCPSWTTASGAPAISASTTGVKSQSATHTETASCARPASTMPNVVMKGHLPPATCRRSPAASKANSCQRCACAMDCAAFLPTRRSTSSSPSSARVCR